MFKRICGERGFTLVELLVVLVILAILTVIVVSSLTGFLRRGKSSSFAADADTIQAAVDAYYTDSVVGNNWPTIGGQIGTPSGGAASYIDFDDLTTNRFLKAAPVSRNSTNLPAGGTGSYGWYIDARGLVQAGNTENGVGYNGKYP